ncbi:MAG: ERF family protein [Firmicutes bacterium]|nr:ERF family protein [Bacillota bacterium]
MIQEKLIAVQRELKAPKGQRNTFGNYNYRSCEDILEAVKPILAKHGLLLTLSDEMVEVGGRIYVKAMAMVQCDKEAEVVTAYAREEETKKGMDASQITGAASSYARKYALNGLFCIDDTKDSDATNTHGKEEDLALVHASESAAVKEYKCERCGKKIEPYEYNGKAITVKRHVVGSVDKYGKILCPDCINESKNS